MEVMKHHNQKEKLSYQGLKIRFKESKFMPAGVYFGSSNELTSEYVNDPLFNTHNLRVFDHELYHYYCKFFGLNAFTSRKIHLIDSLDQRKLEKFKTEDFLLKIPIKWKDKTEFIQVFDFEKIKNLVV
jgi:hypothetical protein